MAAEVNARHNRQPTIAFTLPISCQICLGKVKNPVLCPNQHVFCGPCMDVWLQKNKQCPACRVTMTSTKKIIGGLSQQEEDPDKLTNPELRKARFDILYKEYENEFERMHSEIQLLKTENQILKQQSKKDGLTPGRSGDAESAKAKDTTHLLALTKKLQDATKVYEKVKGDLTRLKQENTNLKDENLSLNRENQHVRQELAGRSPHRYGRITVSTLETKLASAEKDVTRLTKALERSDKYIEELETELGDYRGKSGAPKRHNSASDREDKYLTNGDVINRKYSSDSKVPSSREYSVGADNPSRRQLFTDDKEGKSVTGERSKYYYERNEEYNDDLHASKPQSAKSNGANGGKKRVTFDLEKNTNSAMSFDLELPSPLKTSANASGLSNGRSSPVKGVLKKTNGKAGSGDKSSDGYSTDMSKTLEDSLSDSYNKKYSSTDRYAKDDDLLYVKSRSRSNDRDFDNEPYSTKPHRKYSADDSVLSNPSDLELRRTKERSKLPSDYGSRPSDDLGTHDYRSQRSSRDKSDELDRHDLDDTQYIESELDELNISLTPEFTDCMKILNRAEKNVHTRDSDPEDFPTRYTSRSSSDTNDNMDTAFRASTGSLGYKPSSSGDDYLTTNYRSTDTNNFASSLDSYSRGRHMRSGSLDNLLNIDKAGERDRPSSALPTTSNMYAPNSQNKYSGGLTTGRTTLTRTPSLDNLLTSRPDPYGLKGRGSMSNYLGQRIYRGENDDKFDVKSSTGVGSVTNSATQQALTANHDVLGSQIGGNVDRISSTGDGRKSAYDAVLDARARVYAGDTGSSVTSGLLSSDKLPPTGRSTPTLPYTSTGMDLDKHAGTGRITPTIPTHSEYMALSKSNSDKYNFTSTSNYTSSNTGRSTPTLTSNTDYSSLTNPNTQFSDYRSSGPSSLPTDLSQKPPTGARGPEPSIAARSSYTGSYVGTNPSYPSSSYASANTNPTSEGYSSLPSYMGASAADSRTYGAGFNDANKYTSGMLGASSSRSSELGNDFGANANYRSDGKFSASGNAVPPYNDHLYKDGTDFSNFSTKVAVNTGNASNMGNVPLPTTGFSSNNFSTSSAGPSSYSGTSSYTGSSSLAGSSYPGSSYLTSSLPSSASSYATAHSVPLTHTTSSYTSSIAASSNSYVPKPLDPIVEAGHYSYVSNASGADYSSKNDTFALPEPKKRLFENSDDLEMSMSPIKSNRRY